MRYGEIVNLSDIPYLSKTDLGGRFIEFLNFVAQYANRRSVMRAFDAIQDDIFNLSASLAKLSIIHSAADNVDGSARMAATEVEYILFVCRSLFDLL